MTALSGVLLLVLLFVEGITLLAIRALFTVHVFVDILVVPPLLLKLGSTGYRFIRYYAGTHRYREAGPPRPLLRLLAPLLVLSVVALIATGIVLLLVGPGDGPWRRLHTLSFIAWFWVMTVHVLAYTGRAVRLAWLDTVGKRGQIVAGVMTRRSLIMASVILGIAIVFSAVPLNSAWLHGLTLFHSGQ